MISLFTITKATQKSKGKCQYKMKLAIIAAISENNVIGNKGKIPWHIPEDLKRFKVLTSNHPVIMGRNTYFSILEQLGKPLPNRTNIVLSQDLNFKSDNKITVVRHFPDAVRKASLIGNEMYFIGGKRIYEHALHVASHMHLTLVKGNYNGDTFFPLFNEKEWEEISREKHEKFSFVDFKRKYWKA